MSCSGDGNGRGEIVEGGWKSEQQGGRCEKAHVRVEGSGRRDKRQGRKTKCKWGTYRDVYSCRIPMCCTNIPLDWDGDIRPHAGA